MIIRIISHSLDLSDIVWFINWLEDDCDFASVSNIVNDRQSFITDVWDRHWNKLRVWIHSDEIFGCCFIASKLAHLSRRRFIKVYVRVWIFMSDHLYELRDIIWHRFVDISHDSRFSITWIVLDFKDSLTV